MLTIKNMEMDLTASSNAVVLDMSATIAQCQGPNYLYSDTNLCFTTYIYCQGSKIASNPTAQLLLQSHRCTSLYAENKAALALGCWDAHRSIATSQTLLTCCAAMVQFILWVIKCHIHLAVNCKKGGLDSAYRWIPKYRCCTQMFTCE